MDPEEPRPPHERQEPLPLPRRVIGWAAIVEGFLGGRPASTRESYGRTVEEWTAWCSTEGFDPLTVTFLDVQRWADELADRHKPRTVRRKITTLRGAYKAALRAEAVRSNPADDIRTPLVDDELTTAVALSEENITSFAEAGIAAGPFETAVVYMYFTQGLRASEPANADVGDFRNDEDPPVLRVTRKGGKREKVPLAPETVDALVAYVGDRRQGPLLVNPNTGGRLSRHSARRIVMRLAKLGQLPRGVTTHTFRHAYVTRGGDLGVPLEAVQDGAGHANPATTRHYDRGRQQRALSASTAVAKWLQLRLDGTTEEAAQNSCSGRPDEETTLLDPADEPEGPPRDRHATSQIARSEPRKSSTRRARPDDADED